MHGLVAYKYSDNTAKSQGRLKINPLFHIDPVGTILVPVILFYSSAPCIFGWARPFPITITTVMRNGGTRATVYVSLAGITYNFFLAIMCAILLPLFSHPSSMLKTFMTFILYQSIINILLGIFNLWPIPHHNICHNGRKCI